MFKYLRDHGYVWLGGSKIKENKRWIDEVIGFIFFVGEGMKIA